jgi:hypothetical protein
MQAKNSTADDIGLAGPPAHNPPPPPADAELAARHRAQSERRWQFARAEFETGVAIGALPPDAAASVTSHVTEIYCAHIVAEGRDL